MHSSIHSFQREIHSNNVHSTFCSSHWDARLLFSVQKWIYSSIRTVLNTFMNAYNLERNQEKALLNSSNIGLHCHIYSCVLFLTNIQWCRFVDVDSESYGAKKARCMVAKMALHDNDGARWQKWCEMARKPILALSWGHMAWHMYNHSCAKRKKNPCGSCIYSMEKGDVARR